MPTEHALYQLGSTANYRYDICRMGFENYDAQALMYKKDFPDVIVTRPGTDTDLGELHRGCLMTINGYVYSTVWDNNKLYIPQATKSMLRSRANEKGIIDLSRLSSNITKTKITTEMLSADLNQSCYEKIFIKMPHEVQRPILIMSGYMIFEDPEFFYRVSSDTFALRLSRLDYVEKLYELFRYRNIFEELSVPVSPNNDTMIDGEFVRSDVVVKRFLSNHNSFLVDLNTSNLSVKKVFLERSNIPGNFRTEIKPTMPLIVGYGKVSEYARRASNETKYTVTTQDAHYDNFLFSHQATRTIGEYNAHRLPGQTYRLTQGFFLDISVDL